MSSTNFSVQPVLLQDISGVPLSVANPFPVHATISGVVTTQVPGPNMPTASSVAVLEDSMGSSRMDIDGSSTAYTFSSGPVTGTWYVSSIRVVIVDHGKFKYDEFASADALSVGVKLSWTIQGVEYVHSTLKDNTDIALAFGATTSKVGEDDDDESILVYESLLPSPVELSTGDILSAVVQDDLKGLDMLKVSICYSVEV